MQTVTLTHVSRTERTAKGSGKPYTSLGIKTTEYGATWLSGFGNKDNAHWKEGDKVDIIITDRETDGKIYKNFETPKKEDLANAEIEKLKNELTTLKMSIGNWDGVASITTTLHALDKRLTALAHSMQGSDPERIPAKDSPFPDDHTKIGEPTF